jgi:hypothetical protein
MSARRPGVRLVLDRSLSELAYRCWPDGCPRDRTCCVGLVVETSRREVRAIDSLMDELATMLPRLHDGDAFASVFIEDPPGYVIEAGDDGACPFLLRTRRHALCAIHALALRTGRPVASVKPASCRHWPLLLDVARGRVRLTVQPTAMDMGCVAPRGDLPGRPSVREAFSAEIAELCRANSLTPPAPSRLQLPRVRQASAGSSGTPYGSKAGSAVELNREEGHRVAREREACAPPGAGSPSCPPWRTARLRGRGRCPSRRRTACGRRGTTARRR